LRQEKIPGLRPLMLPASSQWLVSKFVAENIGGASHLVGGYLSRHPKSFDAIAPGQRRSSKSMAEILPPTGITMERYTPVGCVQPYGLPRRLERERSHMGLSVPWLKV
jgi:hypothetical protein